jgi:hypothetical protein
MVGCAGRRIRAFQVLRTRLVFISASRVGTTWLVGWGRSTPFEPLEPARRQRPFAVIWSEGLPDMAALDWSRCQPVESIPGKVSGAWVFRGTRLPVMTVIENLEDLTSMR